MNIGNTKIEWWEDTHTVRVTLPDGRELLAAPEDTEDYLNRAKEHGYDNSWEFCLDHEIGHVLLSWITYQISPTLLGVADKREGGKYYTHWWAEEAAVLGFQRFAKFSGTSIQEIAEGLR